MADISGTSEDLDKFIEAVRKATSSLSDGSDLASELENEEKDRNRTLKREFDKLGLSLKDSTTAVNKDVDSLKERTKNEKLVNDTLKASGKVRADATKEEIEAYKLTQKQNETFRSQLDAMGKYLDETGKVIDTSVKLSSAQQRQLTQEKLSSDKQNVQEQNRSELQTKLATTFSATGLATIALKAGFELLQAGVEGTYKGMLAMQDAALAGAEDDTVRAAAVAAQADSLAATYSSLGTAALAAAAGLAILGGPVGLALAALAGIIGITGVALAKEKELESKRAKQQAEQSKELFAGYQKLANASLVGADGITGLYRDLHKLGLSVAEFEKLNKVLSSNTKEMAMFAGTTISGVKLFTKQAGDLLKSDLGRTLEIMGIGAEEQYQHQVAFMTQQAQFGIKINGDIKGATYNYINELDKLAVLTGQSRKEQEDDRKVIMSLNQLRAAQIVAEENGDKAKSAELQRAFETASKLRGVDAQAAEGLAKYFSAGGAVDQSSARAAQIFGGKGGTIEQIKSGNGSQVDRYGTGVQQLYRQEARFANTTRMTGGVEGQTGETGKIVDANRAYAAAKAQADKTGESVDKILEAQKKVTDKATDAQVDRMREQRDFKLSTDDMVQAGYSFGDATKLFGEAVDEFVTGKKRPKSSGGTAAAAAAAAAVPTSGSGADDGSSIMAAAGQTGNAQLEASGLKIKKGDVNARGSSVDPKLLEIAKQVQSSIPGFNYFSGFNDQYHQENSPRSQHTKGLAFDFTVNPGQGKSKPSKEDSDKIIKMLGGMGLSGIKNEYDNPSDKATGGHFHAELAMPKAYDGGVFDGPTSGYPVEMHGREAFVPLPDPSSKIRIETPTSKQPLSSVMADNSVSTSTSTTMNGMMTDIFGMMSSKMDDMIDLLDRGNNYSDKLVKAMA
jgi:hypothetical protein